MRKDPCPFADIQTYSYTLKVYHNTTFSYFLSIRLHCKLAQAQVNHKFMNQLMADSLVNNKKPTTADEMLDIFMLLPEKKSNNQDKINLM